MAHRVFYGFPDGRLALVEFGSKPDPRRRVRRRDPKPEPVSHLRLDARFGSFERWSLLDDGLDWTSVLVECTDDGFMVCETGKRCSVSGKDARPEDVVHFAILALPGFEEGEVRPIRLPE